MLSNMRDAQPLIERGKHVIFLGAGASHGSGYPLANGLRLLLCSQPHLQKFAVEMIGPEAKQGSGLTQLEFLMHYFVHLEGVHLFRRGCFATVDEFCRLASRGSEKFKAAVDDMRHLTMVILGLHNPEANFHNSEYYGFVQRLFTKSLDRLRDDIVVLSFNYDVYLDFLLKRAVEERCTLAGRSVCNTELNACVSGFLDQQAWVKSESPPRGFALLKLHGSMCHPDVSNGQFGYEHVFMRESRSRVNDLLRTHKRYSPQILFPWELFDSNVHFLNSKTFPNMGSETSLALRAFEKTWLRAQYEVATASKLSFVGLSAHEYLADGFRFLFENRRKGLVDLVMADPGNEPIERTAEIDLLPVERQTTPAYRLSRMLSEVAPCLQTGSTVGKTKLHIRCVSNFAEFIRREMD
jgi:hypothetical protein